MSYPPTYPPLGAQQTSQFGVPQQTSQFGVTQQTSQYGVQPLGQVPPMPPQYQMKYTPILGQSFLYNGIPLAPNSVASEGFLFKTYIAAVPSTPGQLPQWVPVNISGNMVTIKPYGGRGRKSKRRQPKMMRQSMRRASISFTGGRRKRTRHTKRYRKK